MRRSFALRCWLRDLMQSWLPRRRRSGAGRGDKRLVYRPRIECLEDRLVPSSWVVTNTSNSASVSGSLPWAVAQANTDTSNAEITFNPADFTSATTITLAATLTLSNTAVSITINGAGAGPITVSGGGTVQDFVVSPNVTASISSLTITQGNIGGAGGDGGGISNSGTLTLTNDVVSASTAGFDGGGIYNTGVITLNDCTLTQNSAPGSAKNGGGGAFNSGTMTVNNCAITANTVTNWDGGGLNNGGTLIVTDSLFSGNTAGYGGGIEDHGGNTTMIGCTFTGNVATSSIFGGGGIWVFDNPGVNTTMTVSNSTITGNSAPLGGGVSCCATLTLSNCTISGNTGTNQAGGIDIFTPGSGGLAGNDVTLFDNIVAANGSGGDIVGSVSAGTFNLVGDDAGMTGLVNGTSGNKVGTAASPINPQLNTLNGNGGSTQTMSEQAGSPAIGAGSLLTQASAIANTTTSSITVTNGLAFAANSLAPMAQLSFTTQPNNTSPGTILNPVVVQNLNTGAYFYIQIDGEEMAVTSLTLNANDTATFTVIRGVNGTTAATHAANASVYLASDQRGEVASFTTPAVVDMGAYQSTASTPASLNGSPAAGAMITLAISSGTLNGTVIGTTNASGLATYSNLSVPTAGTYSLTATASGATGATSSSFVISASSAPTVTAVSTTTPSGTYGAGTTIPITVTFSGPVVVTGSPTLALNTTPGAVASYAGGTGGTLSTLATFTGTANGTVPNGPLVEDSSGNFFGTTYSGGASNDGTVFEVAAGTHALTTLVTFTGIANGSEPYDGLIEDGSGNLFGTTYNGGASNDGTVFEVAAGTHALTTLVTFSGTNGANPYDSLIEDSSGNLYGTTYFGGVSDAGTVFEVAAGTHALTTLASFSVASGFSPIGGVVEDSSGNLFGTTYTGGASNDGTVFEVAAGTHTLSTLATFTGTNGSNPYAGLIEDSGGNLFGTTLNGGASSDGTVFEVAAGTHTLTTLVTFTGAANGAHPSAGLVEDGSANLFGATKTGGASNDGTVFELAAGTYTLTTLATFTGTANGSLPINGVVEDSSGNLFGTTYGGGASNDGTVFEVAAASSSTLTFNYTVAAGQSDPRLDYTNTSALSLNGGTIQSTGGTNAVLTLPATGSDGLYNQNIVIGTVSSPALSFTTQPTSTTVGSSLGSVTVTDLNGGNPEAGATVTMGISTGSLTGTTTATTNSSGVATFSGLSVGTTGTYTLTASASGAAAASSSFFVVTPAGGGIVVTTASDAVVHTGVSLRDAVNQANADAAVGKSDTITFDPSLDGQTITLTQGALTLAGIGGSIAIDGGNQITVSGSGNGGGVSDFVINANVQALITGLIISGVSASAAQPACAGIMNAGTLSVVDSTISGNTSNNCSVAFYNNAVMTVIDSTISDNSVTNPGVIGNNNGATLTINNCNVSDNFSGVGAIDAAGVLIIRNTTISDNTNTGGATGDEGIRILGQATIIDSTISGNDGLGIFTNGNAGPVAILDSTISGNTGGGISGTLFGTTSFTLSNCTIADNTASAGNTGVGISTAGTINLFNTIVTGNLAGGVEQDINAHALTGTNNIIGVSTNVPDLTNGSSGNQIGTAAIPLNPLLGALANEGGATQTMADQAGSPAIGAGSLLSQASAVASATVSTITVNNGPAFAASPLPILSQLAFSAQPSDTSPGTVLSPVSVQALAAGAYFYIQIDGEEMAVIGLTLDAGNTATLDVIRGGNNTTPATHAANASVYLVSDQRGEVVSFNTPPVVDVGAYQSTASTPAPLGGSPVVGATINLAISSGTLNGILTGTTNSTGLATYSNLSVPTVGTYSLTATSGFSSTTSNVFTIALALTFQTEPTGTTAGNLLAPVIVSAAPGAVVTLSLSSGTLSGTTLATANASGLATFSTLSVATPGTYSMTASATGAISASSSAFIIMSNLAITTTTLPGWDANLAGYSQTITTVNGLAPVSFMVSAGALPAGLSLNGATGVITGTPTTAGSCSFTIKASDPSTATSSQSYTVIINPALSITTASLPNWTANAPGYSQTIVAAGGSPPIAFAISAGSLPAGLSLSSTTGAITGTPTTAGTFSFTITASDSLSASASKSYTVTINPPVAITTTTLPSWTANVSGYSQAIVATGGTGTLSFSVSSGALPAGLTLNGATGGIAGTPTTASTFSFTITATDSISASASQSYTVTINPAVAITTLTLPNWTVNVAGYSQTIVATGGTGALSFSVASGSLPAGLTLNGATGGISGTPTSMGTFSFTIKAADSLSSSASQSYTVTINPAVAISTTTLPSWTANVSGYSQTIVATGGTGSLAFAVSGGSLPAGLSLNAGTGVISGTPTVAGAVSVTVSATDTVGSVAQRSYTFTINPAVSISTTSLPGWITNKPGYSQTIVASGGTGALSFALGSGTLPTGLTLSATGGIAGTPTVSGTYTFAVKASDTLGSSASQTYTVAIGAGAVASLLFINQPSSTPAGSSINPITVEALDAFSNPVPGVVITIGITPKTLSSETAPLTTGASGEVVFTNLTEDAAGTYKLTASASPLSALSNSFTITALGASNLNFLSQPSNTAAGSILNAITVSATDEFGNTVSGTVVTIGIAPGTLSSGTLLATTSATGIAVFTGLSEDVAGTYELQAAVGVLAQASSNSFTITAGSLSSLTFVSQPSNTPAGSAINPITLLAQDRYGNALTGVVIGIQGTPKALTSGTTPLTTTASGEAVFSDLVEDVAGTYALTATSGTLSMRSNAFDITSAAPASLAFVNEPDSTVAGADVRPVTVQVYDKYGNIATGVWVSIALAPGVLSSGTTPQTSGATGQVVFSDLTEDTAGTYSLLASSTGLTGATSNAFTVTAAAAAQVAFATQPSSTTAGTILNPVSVLVTDQFGNPVAGASVGIKLTQGTLSTGTTPIETGSSGMAAFVDLSENQVGTYTLAAAVGSLASVQSNGFTISAAAAASLKFLSQPGPTVVAGATLNPVTVQAADKFGNAVANISVGIALTRGTLSTGTTPLTTNALGQAIFTDLSEDLAGAYTLTASATNLANVNSDAFTVVAAAASSLVFLSQPNSVAVNANLAAITVAATDVYGNPAAGQAISLAISSPGALRGTTTVSAGANGQAIFSSVAPAVGGVFTLTATAGSASATSAPFAVTSSADILKFVSQPTLSAAGNALTGVVTQVTDANGNPLPGVTVSISPAVGSLSGTRTATTNAAGQATFTSLTDTAAGSLVLLASCPGMNNVTSSVITITAAAPAKVVFLSQPAGTSAGKTLTAVTVEALDKFGNPVVGAPVAISTSSGRLSGTLTATSNASGQASFTNLVETVSGTFTLSASVDGMTGQSAPFTVSAAAGTTLSFQSQPASTTAGKALSPITVKVLDSYGNVVSGTTVSLYISLGTVNGTTTATTNSMGQAIFSNLDITKTGTYTLSAAATGATKISSNSFTITPAAGHLTFVSQPVSTSSSSLSAVTVSLVDEYGNAIVGQAITVALSSGTLGGTTTLTTNAAGQVTFSNLTIAAEGTGYKLIVSAAGSTAITSNAFNVT